MNHGLESYYLNKLLFFIYYIQKGGVIIEEKVLKLKKLMNSDKKEIIKDILNDILDLNIKEIKYDKNISLSNMSEYEFELVKVKVILESNDEVEMYLKMIKNSKIKESIFCYWCTIYEEELLKTENEEDVIINKVAISDLTKTKFQKRVFLTIENNRKRILESGTEVNFIEMADYINEKQNTRKELGELTQYFREEDEEVLLVGIKMNRY